LKPCYGGANSEKMSIWHCVNRKTFMVLDINHHCVF
jgi:hypothetical protein